MQYALNTETLQHQPFSANTFYRLRTRLNSIYEETGRDILEEITDMMNFAMEEEVIGNLPYNDLLDKVYRIDSLNISMHGKHMSRLELIYVINRMCINIISALKGEALIPEEFQHYLEKQDHNRVIYFKGTLAELEAEAVKKGVSIEEIEAEAAKLFCPLPQRMISKKILLPRRMFPHQNRLLNPLTILRIKRRMSLQRPLSPVMNRSLKRVQNSIVKSVVC